MKTLDAIMLSVVLSATPVLASTNQYAACNISFSNRTVQISFKTEADNLKYRLQRCTNLVENSWVNVGGYIIGDSGKYILKDINALDKYQQSFYRIKKE